MQQIWSFKAKFMEAILKALNESYPKQEIKKAIHKITFNHLDSQDYKESNTSAAELAVLKALNQLMIQEKLPN